MCQNYHSLSLPKSTASPQFLSPSINSSLPRVRSNTARRQTTFQPTGRMGHGVQFSISFWFVDSKHQTILAWPDSKFRWTDTKHKPITEVRASL